jgi:4-alpha-glucanotransferase
VLVGEDLGTVPENFRETSWTGAFGRTR